MAFAFPPPAIPGVGTSGGVTFMLEDRAGKDVAFLAEQTTKFIAAARKRPEFASALHHASRQRAAGLRRRGPRQGAQAGRRPERVYQTLQAFMGGAFVNYFNRFGRDWQVYVQAEGEYRTQADERRPVLRAQRQGRAGAAVDAGHA